MTWADFYGGFARALGVPLRTISDEEFARRQSLRQPARRPLDGAHASAGCQGRVDLARNVGLREADAKTEPAIRRRQVGGGVVASGPAGREAGAQTGRADRLPRGVSSAEEDFEFELTRPLVRNDKARQVLGLEPVPRERAMELTLAWLRYARIVP